MMQPITKKFLRAWLWWVMTGAVESNDNRYRFKRDSGLCWSTYMYTRGTSAMNLEHDLKRLFIRDGFDEIYPFGETDYDRRNDKRTMHLCPKRVGWVIKVLEENPDE